MSLSISILDLCSYLGLGAVGAATITGVPAFGFPKIKRWAGCIFSPAFAASPLWSMRARMVRPFLRIISSRRLCVSANECGLAR